MNSLPPWFTKAWVIVCKTPRGRKLRYITCWTRAKADRHIEYLKRFHHDVYYLIIVSKKP